MTSFRRQRQTCETRIGWQDVPGEPTGELGGRPNFTSHLFVYREAGEEQGSSSAPPTRAVPETAAAPALDGGCGRDESAAGDPDPSKLTDGEVFPIQAFYSGLATEVYVCPTWARVCMRRRSGEWLPKCTGVPVLLFSPGLTRARDKRQLQLVISDSTPFVLLSDVIDNLSNYRRHEADFHTFHHSADHGCVVGLRFLDAFAAEELFRRVQKLSSDPTNISLSAPKSKAKPQPRPKRRPLPKTDISNPCCFSHVSGVHFEDGKGLLNVLPSLCSLT